MKRLIIVGIIILSISGCTVKEDEKQTEQEASTYLSDIEELSNTLSKLKDNIEEKDKKIKELTNEIDMRNTINDNMQKAINDLKSEIDSLQHKEDMKQDIKELSDYITMYDEDMLQFSQLISSYDYILMSMFEVDHLQYDVNRTEYSYTGIKELEKYYKVTAEGFNTMDDLKKHLNQYLSKSKVTKLLNERDDYIDYNGVLFTTGGEGGSGPEKYIYEYMVIKDIVYSEDKTTCKLEVYIPYADYSYESTEHGQEYKLTFHKREFTFIQEMNEWKIND